MTTHNELAPVNKPTLSAVGKSSSSSTGKSLTAFRTIGETAEIIGVAQHVLRFWESKIKQINPLKRRGRRYYRPEDIDTLKQIKTLLYTEGYTVKGVQKTLNAAPKPLTVQTDLFGFDSPPAATDKQLQPLATAPIVDAKERIKLEEILSGLCQSRDRLATLLK